MAANTPFQVNISSSLGLTVNVASSAAGTSGFGTLVSTPSAMAPVILVSNLGQAAWVRFSASVAPTATAADIAIPANTVRLFANPVPAGTLGIAVNGITVSNSMMFFTPGQGGI